MNGYLRPVGALFAILALTSGCAPTEPQIVEVQQTTVVQVIATPELTEPQTLTIFHVNDRHAHMAADPYLAALINNTPGEILVLDAGDTVHGAPAAGLSQGETMVQLSNAVGYDAMAPAITISTTAPTG